MHDLPVAKSESLYIESSSIRNLLYELEAKELDMHSLLIMHHGKLVSECYWKPYTKESLQRMYSVTKSLVSIAIGILDHQKRLSLTDRICDYFPEKLPKDPSPALLKTTILDMLRMESCHKKTTYKDSDNPDWVGSFFTTPADHAPGSFFLYDTSATHVLGALVEKLTGMELLEFLRKEMLDGIGFSKEAYILKDPQQVSLGGSGLMCTSRDLMKLAREFTNKNSPYHAYFQEASRKQVDTWPDAAGGLRDLQNGYGYCVWCGTFGSYYFYGMGGQLALFVPAKDLIIITTAWVKHIRGGLQELFYALWRFVDGVDAPKRKQGEEVHFGGIGTPLKEDCLRRQEQNLSLRHAPGKEDVACRLGSYVLEENETGIRKIEIERDENKLIVTCNDTYRASFGIGYNEVGPFLFQPEWQCASSTAMDDHGILRLRLQILGPELGDMTLLLAPSSLRVSLCLEPKIAIHEGVAFCTFTRK